MIVPDQFTRGGRRPRNLRPANQPAQEKVGASDEPHHTAANLSGKGKITTQYSSGRDPTGQLGLGADLLGRLPRITSTRCASVAKSVDLDRMIYIRYI